MIQNQFRPAFASVKRRESGRLCLRLSVDASRSYRLRAVCKVSKSRACGRIRQAQFGRLKVIAVSNHITGWYGNTCMDDPTSNLIITKASQNMPESSNGTSTLRYRRDLKDYLLGALPARHAVLGFWITSKFHP